MKAVLDTNQFVSSLINPEGTPARILRAWFHKRIEIATSRPMLQELKDVLQRPQFHDYAIPQEDVDRLLLLLSSPRSLVPGNVEVLVMDKDPADNMVLACALESNADFIVTGDRHLLNLKEYQRIRIVRAAEFLEILASEGS